MTNCLMCQRYDDTGGYLCLGCTKDTRVRLECWPDLYAGLAPFLAPSGRAAQMRGSRPVYAPLPVSEDVLDLRGPGGLVGVAERWLYDVRRARQLPKARPPMGSVEGRLKSAVAELLGHLPWVVVSWPDAGLFAVDIRDVTRGVASLVSPPEPVDRGTRMGACPADVGDGAVCGAVLRLYAGAKVVTCEWCSTSYPPATWSGLKVLMDEDLAPCQP
ncbi:hypothetical protein ACFQ7W_00685 [Streptomyces niveus]|uniref:hypothetical protein n=1 Tax=Streptomyces niveus TaxID=193462 RepID=UPI0036C04931